MKKGGGGGDKENHSTSLICLLLKWLKREVTRSDEGITRWDQKFAGVMNISSPTKQNHSKLYAVWMYCWATLDEHLEIMKCQHQASQRGRAWRSSGQPIDYLISIWLYLSTPICEKDAFKHNRLQWTVTTWWYCSSILK